MKTHQPISDAQFKQRVCDECWQSQIAWGYIDGGLIERESLESRLKEINQEVDRLEAEKKVLYDQIEKLELKEQAA